MRFLSFLGPSLHTREVAGSKPAAPIIRDGRRGLVSSHHSPSGSFETSRAHPPLPAPGAGFFTPLALRLVRNQPRPSSVTGAGGWFLHTTRPPARSKPAAPMLTYLGL